MLVCANLNENQRWQFLAILAALFVLLSLPIVYRVTGMLTRFINWRTSYGGVPNIWGILLHGVIFAIALRLLFVIDLPLKR